MPANKINIKTRKRHLWINQEEYSSNPSKDEILQLRKIQALQTVRKLIAEINVSKAQSHYQLVERQLEQFKKQLLGSTLKIRESRQKNRSKLIEETSSIQDVKRWQTKDTQLDEQVASARAGLLKKQEELKEAEATLKVNTEARRRIEIRLQKIKEAEKLLD